MLILGCLLFYLNLQAVPDPPNHPIPSFNVMTKIQNIQRKDFVPMDADLTGPTVSIRTPTGM